MRAAACRHFGTSARASASDHAGHGLTHLLHHAGHGLSHLLHHAGHGLTDLLHHAREGLRDLLEHGTSRLRAAVRNGDAEQAVLSRSRTVRRRSRRHRGAGRGRARAACRRRPGPTRLARRRRRAHATAAEPQRSVGWRPAPVRTSRAPAPARKWRRATLIAGATRGGACAWCGDGDHDATAQTRERRRRSRGSGSTRPITDEGSTRSPNRARRLKRLEQRGRVRPGRDPWRRGGRPPAATAATGSAAAPRSCRRSRARGTGNRRRRRGGPRDGTAGSGRDGGPADGARADPSVSSDFGSPVAISDLDVLAAPAADELVVLLAEPAAGAEQGALDDRPRHPQPFADLAVGEPLELAHHDDPVVALGQAVEGAAEVVEAPACSRPRRRASGRRRAAGCSVVGVVVLGLERDLAGAASAAELVDAGVLGDLVDPRLERDRALGLAQAAQRRDEDLLGDVLGAGVVADHARGRRRRSGSR